MAKAKLDETIRALTKQFVRDVLAAIREALPTKTPRRAKTAKAKPAEPPAAQE